ncbi:hypothetical protein TNCV_2920701 [Trichonephila clavipes]|nr:hypothetical protein TNCV_2920701 [Trichonephila clavipes]
MSRNLDSQVLLMASSWWEGVPEQNKRRTLRVLFWQVHSRREGRYAQLKSAATGVKTDFYHLARWKRREKSACAIEREIRGFVGKFLEESRGSRTGQHGPQCRQNGNQTRHKLGRQ